MSQRMEKLTKAQVRMLRSCSGEKLERWERPRTRWQQEQTVRALIDRGLISPVGWALTEAGRAALARAQETSR